MQPSSQLVAVTRPAAAASQKFPLAIFFCPTSAMRLNSSLWPRVSLPLQRPFASLPPSSHVPQFLPAIKTFPIQPPVPPSLNLRSGSLIHRPAVVVLPATPS
ncbi:hypothetical protein AAC387_Pa12g0402 [Persea americana]